MEKSGSKKQGGKYSPGALARGIRLSCGCVLWVYLSMHLANLTLGLISLEVMERWRPWLLGIWQSFPGILILYGSLIVHGLLAFWSLYRRRHFRMPLGEGLQILLGLAVLPLLADHVVGTRVSHAWFGTDHSYSSIILYVWVLKPKFAAKQGILLVVAWLHACLGLHYWLRARPWYSRWAAPCSRLALLLPVLALLGFTHAGREISSLSGNPDWVQETLAAGILGTRPDTAALAPARDAIWGGYGVLLVLTLLARRVRARYEKRRKSIRITYPGGKSVMVPAGFTVLEASRKAGIPHASVCGGRGRCTTCRVRVTRGLDSLSPPSPEESRVLGEVAIDPAVRLACQLRPTRNISVIPVIPVAGGTRPALDHKTVIAGHEQEIAVLFADLRGFTRIAEHKLPYDVVFLLNRYFDVVGDAIELAGGTANQFTGDGVMALFGLEVQPRDGSRQALMAACEMVRGLSALSASLAEVLHEPLRVGIGIHTGQAVVGHMGHGVARYLTAVGDTVHVASRLEELTKEYGCTLIISDAVADRAGVDVSPFPRYELMVRNRERPITIRTIKDVESLALLVGLDPA